MQFWSVNVDPKYLNFATFSNALATVYYMTYFSTDDYYLLFFIYSCANESSPCNVLQTPVLISV
jgi:hypothetical protein